MWNKILKFPALNIIIITVITLIGVYGLTRLKPSSMFEMLPENNEVYLNDQKIKKIYNTGDIMSIGIKSKSGNIFTINNLQTIDRITKSIQDIKSIENKTDIKKSEDTTNDYSDMLESIESDDSTNKNIQNITNKKIIDSVKSITNIELIEGIDGGLSPVKLEKFLPANEKELLLFKEKVLSWDIYQDAFYSKDFSSSSIIINFSGECNDDDQKYVYEEIKKLIKNNTKGDLEYYIAGMPVVKTLILNYIKDDLYFLIPLVILVLVVILFLSFRNIRNVLLPLITVCVSTIWTIGLMGFLGIKLSIIGVVIPVLLIAVGSAYGIHIISHYMEDITNDPVTDRKKNKELLILTMKKVFVPVLLAALTTFFGFMSLLTVNIILIIQFGIFLGIGVIIELILSLILIPSIIILMKPVNKIKNGKNNNENKDKLSTFEITLLKIAKSLRNKKITVLIGFLLLITFLIYGTLKVKVDFDSLKLFKANSDIVKANKFINENLSGADTIYLNVVGTEDGSLANPEILDAIDKLGIYLINKHKEIGKYAGFNDLIKRMNQVMNYPDNEEYKKFITSAVKYEDILKIMNSLRSLTGKQNPDYKDFKTALNKYYNYNGYNYYEIPMDPDKYNISDDDIKIYIKDKNIDFNDLDSVEKIRIKREILKQLISQYLLLYSGNLDELIAKDQLKPNMAKISITLKENQSNLLKTIKKDIVSFTKENFPEGYTVEISGTAMMSNEMNNIVVFGQASSFLLAIIVVFLIVALSYRSIAAGTISIIPLSVSILINFAVMGFLNLDLNLATILVASLSIGMGVDYAIHFLSFYKYNWKIYKNIDKAIEMTLLTSGKAILSNAFSVGLGFGVLLFSNTRILGTLGILITLTMITSALGALIIIPIIIEMFKPKFADK